MTPTVIYPRISEKILTVFGDTLSKIKILKRNNDGTSAEYLVPIRFSAAEKMLSHARSDTFEQYYKIQLPAMGFQITSISLDEGRVLNPLCKLLSSTSKQIILNPIPYNYSITLTLITKYMQDYFAILENILSLYKSPVIYPFIEFKFLDGDSITRDLPILLQDTTLNLKTEDIEKEGEQLITGDLSFILKGWIYPSQSFNDGKFIESIDIKFMQYQETLIDQIIIP